MTPFIREFTAGADWQTLAELFDELEDNEEGTTKRLGFKGQMWPTADNGSAIQIRFGLAAGTTLVPNEWFEVHGVNIANIQIKGDGLVLKVLGTRDDGWN